jgi:PhoH-like ATPase
MTSSTIQNVSLTEALAGKVVVTDTSSLLIAGTHLLEILSDCKVVIPAVVVKELEEKRTHATLGFLAREWLRLIETYRISDPNALRTGVALTDHPGISLQIEPNHSNQTSLPKHLQDGSHDSTILAVAVNLKNEYAEADSDGNKNPRVVVLLSNDMPMRLHSTLELSIEAFEYTSAGKVSVPFQGRFNLELNGDEADEYGVYTEGLSEDLKNAVLANLPDGVASTSFTEIFIGGQSTKTAVLVTDNGSTKVTPHGAT